MTDPARQPAPPAGGLAALVARSSDAADLHAAVPTLLLELQAMLGALSRTATTGSDRGRRPFRPSPEWTAALGELAYGVYLVADQSGVDLDAAVAATAQRLAADAQRARERTADEPWPFPG